MRTPIKLEARVREQLEGAFQRSFFESALKADPVNLDCLVHLGDVYSRQGEHHKGLEIDTRLTELCPEEPTFFYNLACSYSLLDRCEEAAEALTVAIGLGYEALDIIEGDEDLENLRHSPYFHEIVAEFFPFRV